MEETNFIINWVGGLEYSGIFILALAANMIVPVPEEIVLLVSGYLTGVGIFRYHVVAIIFIVGMFISDVVLFYLSRKGGGYIEKLKAKIKNKNLAQDGDYVKKNIKKIIFISRFLVYIRFIGPVLAGSTQTKWKTFLFYDFIALCVYVPFVLFIGNYFHENISVIISGIAKFKNYILFVLFIFSIYLLFKYINKSFIKKITNSVIGYIPTIIPGLSIKNEKKSKED